MLLALVLLVLILFSDTARKNISSAFQNAAWKTLVIFLLLTFISIPFAVWPGFAFDRFIEFFKLCLFCLMVVSCIRTEEQFNKYILLYIVCMMYVAYGPLHNYLSGIYLHDYSGGIETLRIASPIRFYHNPNELAITLLQCLPFIYYRVVYNGLFREKFQNIIWLACIALILFIVVITGSRGGFIVLAGLAFIISYRSNHRKLAIFGGIALAVIVWYMMGEELQRRYLTIGDLGASDKSASDRILGLKHGFMMLLDHPLLGVGVGCYPVARWHMFETDLWAHNLLGQLMGELGILGTITFLVLLLKCYKNTRESRKILVDNGLQKSLLYYHCMALEASLFAQILNGIGQHSLYLFGFYVTGALTVIVLRLVRERAETAQAEQVHIDTTSGPAERKYLPVEP